MALYHESIIDIDLEEQTVVRTFFNHALGEGDSLKDRFGVRLFRNGEPVELDGATCVGYFIRYPSGDTVVINGGTFSGNTAYVELPEACYVYPGRFSLVIKIASGDVNGTMRIVDGYVADTLVGPMIDPGGVIPDLSDLLEIIERAEAAAEIIAGYSVTAELVSGENYNIVVVTSE